MQDRDLAEFGLGSAIDSRLISVQHVVAQSVNFRKTDLSFDRDYRLDLGGVHVRMIVAGPAHTRGDTVFLVEEDRVLFAGDVIMPRFLRSRVRIRVRGRGGGARATRRVEARRWSSRVTGEEVTRR
jgi:glyoxylase-like metal-dependent hydrolase (beta-lactamase superfamily II)